MYHDYSCCRDKVNRAAGLRAVGSVFCSPFRKCTLTINFLAIYRDSYVRQFYLDEKTTGRLPGLAKNSPTPTQTATPHTTGPLCCNNILSSSARLPQIQFAGLPGQIDNSLTNPYRVTKPFSHDSRKQVYPSASLFFPDSKFVPPGQTLNLYFTRLAPLACIW